MSDDCGLVRNIVSLATGPIAYCDPGLVCCVADATTRNCVWFNIRLNCEKY